jgi:probable HAF family extracellular repeat protein
MRRSMGVLLVAVGVLGAPAASGQVVVKRLGSLGGSAVNAYDLNDAGQVAGDAYTAGDQELHAVLFQDGIVTDLTTLGGTSASAVAVNDDGHAVGHSSIANDVATHAFLYEGTGLVDLGTLGGAVSTAVAINQAGWVAGSATVPSDLEEHAFLFNGSQMVDLGTLGGSFSTAVDVNAGGQVTGSSYLAGDLSAHAFLYSGGVMGDLGSLGGSYSAAASLNDQGLVVGEASTNGDREVHAFLYNNGSLVDLGTLGGSFSTAYTVNDAGRVAGDSTTPSDAAYHGFVYDAGVLVDLGTLGGDYSSVRDLNNVGQVVGESADGNGDLHAFLWENGVMTDLNTLLPAGSDWELLSARLVNDVGEVVGVGLYQGQSEWFVLSLGEGQTNSPPVADAGPDQVAECTGGLTSVTLDGSASQDPDGDALVYEWTEGGSSLGSGVRPVVALADGTHVVTLTVTDPDGESSQDTVVISVQDTTAPVVSCTPVAPLPAGDACTAVLSDLAAAATAVDQCSPASALTLAQNPPPGTVLDTGMHPVTVTATDPAGNAGWCSVDVEVVDLQAPVVSSVTASPGTLFPPNQTMTAVTVQVTAADNCEPSPASHIVAVLENGADPGSDAVITGALTVDLRAVTANKNRPVVYAVVVECTDAPGNHAQAMVEIPVGRGDEFGPPAQ